MRAINCDLILLIFIVIAECGQAYKNYSLDSSDVCSPNTKRRLKLGSYGKSGMIISQKQLGHHVLEWKVDSKCKFEVKVDQGSQRDAGILVVVQRLDLRVDEETGDCIDYVQFKRRDGTTSRKICGRIDAYTSMRLATGEEFTLEDQEAPNTFVDREGEVDVYVVVDKRALMSHERTDIVIVFTKYKPCSRASATDRPCDIRFRETCIHLGFFGDGVVNCPQYNCLDEDGCWHYDEPKTPGRESLGNKVLIGSVTSLLIMFAFFICCIYMCRKYGALCWSDAFSRPEASTPVTVNTAAGAREPGARAPTETQPVAVPETAPTAPPSEDKDLPPSYESLFPSR